MERTASFLQGVEARRNGVPCAASFCPGNVREWSAGWKHEDDTQRAKDDCDWPAPIREAVY